MPNSDFSFGDLQPPSKLELEEGEEKRTFTIGRHKSESEDAYLLARFPEHEFWLPKGEVDLMKEFSDAGFWWSVWIVPMWKYEEDARKERNVYERRAENGRRLTGSGVPIQTMVQPWMSSDRSTWLRGQIRQLTAEYNEDWARDHGMLSGEGVRETVNPVGEESLAAVEIYVPIASEAEGVIQKVRRGINRELGEVIGSETYDQDGEIVWDAHVYSPQLVR